jgi:hypothetical protein
MRHPGADPRAFEELIFKGWIIITPGDEYETSGVIIIDSIHIAGVDGLDGLYGGEHAPVPVGSEAGVQCTFAVKAGRNV